MTNKVLCWLLTLLVVTFLVPGTALANPSTEGTLQITSSPAGADVYVDGIFTNAVTPCELQESEGIHAVELKIPGYETYTNAAVQVDAGQTTVLDGIKQLPDLIAADADHTVTVTTLQDKARWTDVNGKQSITVEQLKADSGTPISLREAIQAVINEPAGNGHYRIEFAPSLAGGTLHIYRSDGGDFITGNDSSQALCIESRGDLTINGDIDRDGTPDITLDPTLYGHVSSVKGSILNVCTSGVTLAGLVFYGGESVNTFSDTFSTLSIKPDCNVLKYDLNDVRVLGCVFDHSMEVGTAPCGAYGYAGHGYGQPGTFNVNNMIFSGNTFDQTNLFSFAGAGDEDYNVINGYHVASNTFTNCGIGLLASDAHTWYVYGSSNFAGNGGVPGQIGFCEYNIFENVTLSGNHFTLNGNATRVYTSPISISVANMGNQNSTVRDVTIRNNVIKVLDPVNKNCNSAVVISNASINDEGGEPGSKYQLPAAGVEQTANNTLENVSFEYNDVEIGDGRPMQVFNISGGNHFQSGYNNVMQDITVAHNKIKSARGLLLADYSCACELNDARDNVIRRVTVEDNDISTDNTTHTSDFEDVGISVLGAEIMEYQAYRGENYMISPGGNLSDVTVQNNRISGFCSGIMAAGCRSMYVNGVGVDTLGIIGNTITCKPSSLYGIEIFGAGMGSGINPADNPANLRNGSTNCYVKNVTVSGNTVTARGDICLTGGRFDGWAARSIAGNYVEGVAVSGNTFNKLANPEPDKQFIALPVMIADNTENWDKFKDTSPNMMGLRVSGVTLDHNVYHDFTNNALDLSTENLPTGSMTRQAALAKLKDMSDTAVGPGAFEWTWFSTPETNGSSDQYIALGRATVGAYPNLFYPSMLYVQMTGNFAPPVTYRITYMGNGGVVPESAKTSYTEGQSYTLPAPQRNGYDFGGWFDNPSLAGTPLGAIGDTQAGDITLYAKWTAIRYGLSYDLAGGGGESNPPDYTVEDVLTLNNPMKADCTFAGWSGTDIAGISTVVTIPKGSTGNRAYTANWTANPPPVHVTYTVSFNSNGGSGVDAQIVNDKAPASAPVSPNRSGYTFAGWFTAAGAPWDFGTPITDNMTLYAHWTLNSYTVSFDSAGGVGVAAQTVSYGGLIAQPVIPTRTMFNFTGWYTAAGELWNFGQGVTDNLTLYAGWAAQAQSNALQNIVLSTGALAKGFNPKIASYTVNLSESDESVAVTPIKAYDGAAMTIDGKAMSAKTVKVKSGQTVTMTIKVTWNKKAMTYKLTIKRPKNSNNQLANLIASTGSWSAPFNPAVTDYTLTLPKSAAKTVHVILKTAKANSLASVSPASKTVTLKVGQSVKATFKVKAQNGKTRTYTVTVIRVK